MRLDIPAFKGVIPRFAPHLGPPENATYAKDCRMESGSLEPLLLRAAIAAELRTGVIRSIFKYNDVWFSWAYNVEAIRNPLAKDPYERVYFTRDGFAPAVTSNLLAIGGAPYPTTQRTLGIPAPVTAPTPTVIDGGDDADIETDESRAYVYTWVSQYDEEGPPSPPSVIVELDDPAVDTVSLSLPGLSPNTYGVSHRRIYRSATNGSDTNFYFVAELPLATATFVDDRLQNELGAELSTNDYLPPPATMRGIVLGANGIVAGYDGNELLFAEPFLPYAYPLGYRRALEYDIQGIAATSTGFVVGTKGTPYLVQGVHPNAMSEQKIELQQACVSGRSMVDMGDYVLYASPDGLVAVSESSADLITRGIITRRQWQKTYFPASIYAYRYEDLYLAFYLNGVGAIKAFIFDPVTKDFQDISETATAGFNDLLTDTLYLVDTNQLYAWEGTETPKPYTWRSKVFQTQDMSFSVFKAWTDTPELVGVTIWADGKVVLQCDSLLREAVKLAPARGTRWQIELRGTGVVERATLAQSMDELS